MIRRLRWLMGSSSSASNKAALALTNTSNRQRPFKAIPQETIHEVAIYIHRFHNLDLFHQGWYQIKVSLRLEDTSCTFMVTPARVVQYEAAELGCDGAYGIWSIDDTDNSFSTQPFWIKYARQDVYLSIMISFILSLGAEEGPLTSSAILKFELIYAPALKDGCKLKSSLNASPAAVHEFRIPPKALLGLHSYCPIHFDAFYAVLVDVSVHISMLKASCMSPLKAFGEVTSLDSKQMLLIEALIAARDTLLEHLKNISKAIDQEIGLSKSISDLDHKKKAHDIAGFSSDRLLYSWSWYDLSNYVRSLGNEILYLWNRFLMFHRSNKTKILEFLYDAWAEDRIAEWSIWVVYSKDEVPHHYMSTSADDSSFHRPQLKSLNVPKFANDTAQLSAIRAELHRQSIGKMTINSQSLQDMHLFGNPSCVPIVIVERMIHSTSSSRSEKLDQILSRNLLDRTRFGASTMSIRRADGHVMRVVVFVHGFQGHHLDLRLVRNQWLLIDPNVEFLMSKANEDKTLGDFREMGLRLAQEVISFIKAKMDKISRTGKLGNIKLSFVGHSIGNVIIRTALTESIMEPYLSHLHTYLSISGPHLGYLYSSNTLFNSGLWLLKKLKGTQSFHQLTFSDDPDLRNTFFYKLCKVLESLPSSYLRVNIIYLQRLRWGRGGRTGREKLLATKGKLIPVIFKPSAVNSFVYLLICEE
uniref:Protein FAM135B n=1 Tax=Rhizophora mucronata TaxID=61149 RepID=A0A2P2MUS7_RHIMU